VAGSEQSGLGWAGRSNAVRRSFFASPQDTQGASTRSQSTVYSCSCSPGTIVTRFRTVPGTTKQRKHRESTGRNHLGPDNRSR